MVCVLTIDIELNVSRSGYINTYINPTDALKLHRRDDFIEWIKGLLAVSLFYFKSDNHSY